MAQFLLGLWCGCVLSALVACFVFYFVRRKREQGKVEQKDFRIRSNAPKKESVSAPKARILLVDDSKLSRTLIKEFLKSRPIGITEAESGADCLAKCRKESFDLIFMDINMPGGSGTETLEHLRDGGMRNSQTPVIVMGSNVRQENEAKYLELGFADCLAKPIQMSRLEEILLINLPEEVLLPIPDGFSYQNGLKNFDGNEELYKETLVLFSSLWEERKEQLKGFLEEENMPEYAVLIHAIKGDARILGAEVLAELAYEQELRAKEGNAEAVRNGFLAVIETATNMAEYFATAFSA